MQKLYQSIIAGRQLLFTLAWAVGFVTTSAAVRAQTFAAAQTYAANSPFGIAVADVNADGRPDMLTAAINSDVAGVLLGNGDGTFQTAQYYSTGTNSGPRNVVVADVNGDSRPDLITANTNSSTVGVLLGNGNGTFQAVLTYSTGSGPSNIAVADINGDGLLDIVSASSNSATVGVLLGTGTGTFMAVQTYPTGTGNIPSSIALADVNGDSRPDLLLADGNYNRAGVLLGNGNGTFQAVQTYAVGADTRGITVADVNGDGRPDLLMANPASSNNSTVGVLLGNGNGTFQTVQSYSLGTNGQVPTNIVVADVNGDGRLDLIAAGLSSNLLGVLLGNGNGTFQTVQTYSVGAGGVPYKVAVADVNGDGKPDLLSGNSNSNKFAVLLNTSVFPPTITTLAPTSGLVGSTVTLNGTNLTGATLITFTGTASNTVASGYTVNAAGTQITGIVVPSGATTGNVTVTTPGGTSSGVNFTVTVPAPVLTGLNPTTGPVGTSVTISGTNLGGATSVSFNGTPQTTIGSNTAMNLVVAVPAGATTGNVTVTTSGGISNGISFTVTAAAPTISSFSPTFAKSGQTVTVTGTNLTGTTGLTFSGVSQPTFTVNAAGTQLTATVPYANMTSSPDLTSGVIAVTTPGGTATSTTALRLLAVTDATVSVGATSYPGGLTGNSVTISGSGFGGATVTYVLNMVTYPVTYTVVSETQISATVPDLSGSTAAGGSGGFVVTNTPGVSGANFEVLSPVISALSPGSGVPGTVVTVTGFNFQRNDPRPGTAVPTAITGLTFGGVAGTSFQLISPTQARATVPAGAATGNVRTSGGTLEEFSSVGLLFNVSSALAITSTSPTANARAATATGPVAVTFNQAVTSGSAVALRVFSAQRGGLRSTTSGSTTATGSTVSFAPTYAFRPGETVQSTVTTAATAAAGGSLAAPRVYQFTAAAGVGPGTFSGGSDPAVGNSPYSITMADVDADGDLDLLTTNLNANSVSIRLNNGSGSFTSGSEVAVGVQPLGIATGDVDGDGDLDLLTANANVHTVSVRFNNGSGGFSGSQEVIVGAGSGSLALADVDGDGDLDLLTANAYLNTVSVRFNNGSGIFSGGSDPAVGNSPYSIAMADVDGDGDLDLLTANDNAVGTVSVRLNNGSGGFSGGGEVAVGAVPNSLAVGDVDGDGDLDLLTANRNSNTVSVRLNNGSGTFTGGSDPAVGVFPVNVAVGDVDGDGDLDFIVSNSGAATVSVRLNDGSGVFSGGSDPAVGSTPNGVAVSDVDGDGDLDLLTANFISNTVSVRFNQTAATPDLVVSTGTQLSPTPIPAGSYNSITVTSTGNGVLAGNVSVDAFFTVQPGGGLSDGCSSISGAGTFTLSAGSTLGICSPAGITSSGATGSVQVTGTRSFSSGGSYGYTGAAAVTGSGLPATVANLAINTAGNVALTNPVAVTVAVGVGGAGNLVLGGNALTLLSSASGTALAVNSGTGVVNGTATVQRYIDPSLNAGPGYRHYSAPVSNTTVADLTTSGFSPEVSQATAYNSSATPGTTTPFPTVFGYDQGRVALANNYAPFDRGFVVPTDQTTPLAVGRGYAVNLPGTALVDFTGTLTTGDQPPLALNRVAGNPDAGWQLLGNPYPAPLDYALVAPADRANLDGAIYVYSSTAQYVGQYRSYINGVGGNSVLPVAQGFFVRVSAGQTSGALTFRNSQRLTAANATAFQRPAADSRPLVQLELRGATGPADALYAYAQPGATPAFDSQFDAEKLANPTGLNLSSIASAGQRLAIDGRPAFDAATVLPLAVGVPAAGTYAFAAVALSNLPAGLDAYLLDAQTGQTVNLRTQPNYSFTATAAQATALLVGRFSLRFTAAGALATAPALTAAQVALYPNPAHGAFTVLMPGVAGATAVQAELLNALGQVVRRQSAGLPASGATLTVETAGLAAGVYALRLQAGSTTLAKRVVIQ